MPADTTIRDPDTHAVIGAALEVHTVLGCGFLEQVYKDALVMEFRDRGVPFEKEVTLPIGYKGRRLPSFYRVDFVCFGNLLVEIKALYALTSVERAQMINYIKAARVERGLVFNFGARSLEWKRVICSEALHAGENEGGDKEQRWPEDNTPAGNLRFGPPFTRTSRGGPRDGDR